MIQLIASSNFCLLSPDDVERLRRALDLEKLVDKEITRLLNLLASQCQSEINTKQERYRARSLSAVVADHSFELCHRPVMVPSIHIREV